MKQILVLALAFALAIPLAGCIIDAAPPRSAPSETTDDPWEHIALPQETPLVRAVAALRVADDALLGSVPSAEVPRSGLPLAMALLDLARAHDHEPTVEELVALSTLDQVPTETAHALVGVVDAFRHLEATTKDAYGEPGGPDARRIAGAQQALADAAVVLDDAVTRYGTGETRSGSGPITMGSIFAIDLDGFDDVYTKPFILVIDTAGHEVYRNNAGGNAFATEHCSSDDNPAPRVPTTAALIDLKGNDRYSPGRDCGTTGGGAYGVGMLIDAEGDDIYDSGGRGVNGGGYAHGHGLLIEGDGNDVYTASGAGANGGGYAGGVGRLIDISGNDSYTATDYGSNGGAKGAWHCVNTCQEAKFSLGMLLDLGGADAYSDLVVKGNDRTVVPKEQTGMQIDVVLTG